MRQREARRLLGGVVFADDAVLGGVQAGKLGRGSENKAPFMAAVELDDDGHPQQARFDPIDDDKGETFAAWVNAALEPSAHLVTDGCASFNAAGAEVAAHGVIIVGDRKSRPPEIERKATRILDNLHPHHWIGVSGINYKTVTYQFPFAANRPIFENI